MGYRVNDREPQILSLVVVVAVVVLILSVVTLTIWSAGRL